MCEYVYMYRCVKSSVQMSWTVSRLWDCTSGLHVKICNHTSFVEKISATRAAIEMTITGDNGNSDGAPSIFTWLVASGSDAEQKQTAVVGLDLSRGDIFTVEQVPSPFCLSTCWEFGLQWEKILYEHMCFHVSAILAGAKLSASVMVVCLSRTL